jgi:hypothetical protein
MNINNQNPEIKIIKYKKFELKTFINNIPLRLLQTTIVYIILSIIYFFVNIFYVKSFFTRIINVLPFLQSNHFQFLQPKNRNTNINDIYSIKPQFTNINNKIANTYPLYQETKLNLSKSIFNIFNKEKSVKDLFKKRNDFVFTPDTLKSREVKNLKETMGKNSVTKHFFKIKKLENLEYDYFKKLD